MTVIYILCAFAATALFGLAALFLKIGVDRDFPELTFKSLLHNLPGIIFGLLKNWIWLLGLGLNMIGGLFYFVAIAKLDISIVKPVITLYVVVATLLGVMVLKEKLSPGEKLGIAIAVGGALMLALYGETSTGTSLIGGKQYTILNLILIADFIISAVLLLPLIAPKRPDFLSRELLVSIFSGINWGLAAVYFKVFYLEIAAAPFMAGTPNYAGLALSSELWLYLLGSWSFWCTAVLNIVGFGIYQMAFSSGRVAIVAPIVMISTLVAPVVAGKLVFGEALPALKLIGIFTAGAGTAVLALARSRDEIAS